MQDKKQKKIIYIDGYWLDTKEQFFSYKCVLGEPWDGNENDHDIFFYFENEEELEGYKKADRDDSEFVVTKVRSAMTA